MAKERSVIYINGGDIITRGTEIQQALHGIYNNIFSNKTVEFSKQIDCSQQAEPLLGLGVISKQLKTFVDSDQDTENKFPPLIIIDAHGAIKEGVHHTQLSKEKTIPTALIYSTLKESFGEEKIDVIQTSCSPSDTTKYAQILPHGSAVMTMGDSNKSVLASCIDQNIAQINFRQSAEKIFTDIIKTGEHQGFTIPRIEVSGQKEILLREKIIENNKKKFDNLSKDEKADVKRKAAFQEMIEAVYSKPGKIDLDLLKTELKKSSILKNFSSTEYIIATIENNQIAENEKIFQVNSHLRDLDQEVKQDNPELIAIAHSFLEKPDIDMMTKIYPYEEGYDVIKLNNDLYHSTEQPEKLFNDFFQKVVKPTLLHNIKTNPGLLDDTELKDLEDVLKKVEVEYISIVSNSEKHEIIPKILENFYSGNENPIIKEIKSKFENQKRIQQLNPDIIKYYAQPQNKRILLANNVKNNLSENIFQNRNHIITKEKRDSIINDLKVGNNYIKSCIEKNADYEKLCEKCCIITGVQNSIQHLEKYKSILPEQKEESSEVAQAGRGYYPGKYKSILPEQKEESSEVAQAGRGYYPGKYKSILPEQKEEISEVAQAGRGYHSGKYKSILPEQKEESSEVAQAGRGYYPGKYKSILELVDQESSDIQKKQLQQIQNVFQDGPKRNDHYSRHTHNFSPTGSKPVSKTLLHKKVDLYV